MFKDSWFGNGRRNSRAKSKSHPARPKRTILSIETLEDRAVPASIDFANLRFDYDGKLPAPVNGQYQIRTPVTVQLPPQGSNPVRNLMRFDGGVNLPVDASKTDAFSSVGDVWSLAGGGTALRLFDVGATDTRAFDSSDLLGTTNNKLGTKFQIQTGIQKLQPAGTDFTFSTLRVDDLQSKSPALLAKGDFHLNFGLLGTWDIPLPDGGETVNPYVRIHNGASGLGANVSFALPGKSFSARNWTITLGKTDAFPTQNPITFSYSTSAANRINISGDIRLQNDKIFDNKNGVLASLGSSTDAGLQFTNGRLTRFDMSLANQSAFTIKSLNFVPQGVRVVYKEVESKVGNTTATNQVFEISGDAKITKDGKGFFAGLKEIGIFLGTKETKTAKATPGIVITNGALTSLNAGLTIDRINFGNKVSLTDLQLGLAYVPEKAYYGITGGAILNITGLTDTDKGNIKFAVSLGSIQDAQPGIIIENGALKRFDLAVTTANEFQVKKLTVNPRAFRFAYEEESDGTQTFSGYGSIGLKFSLANKPVVIDVTLGDSSGDANGFVVKNGVLDSFQAEVSAAFKLFGTQVDAQSLSFKYVRDIAPGTPGDQSQFVVNGAAGLSNGQSFNLQTNFGTPSRNGLVIEDGTIRDLFITTTGSFNLRGLNVTADGLTIGFNRDSQTVFMSGGIQVRLGSTISFGASITGAGLTFNTDTGQFQIATVDSATPLEIKGNFVIAGFLAVDASFKYQQTAAGVVVAGSGSVNVAGKFGKSGATASFTIINGDLASIALSVRTRITLGATGMSITEMNGSVTNLNDIPRLEISGGVKLEHEAKLGGTTLLSVEGTFTINRDRLNLSGSVNFLNGFATGRGSVDLNWTLGVYKIDASLSIYRDSIKFGGSLEFDSLGNINLIATASLSFPSDWAWIGGYEIASGGFALQIRPGGGPNDSFVAAWGTFLGFIPAGFRYTINTGAFTLDSNPPNLAPLPRATPVPSFNDYEFRNNNFIRDDLWKFQKNERFETVNLHFTAPFFANAESTWLDDRIIIPNAFDSLDGGRINTRRSEYAIRELNWRYAEPGDRSKGIIILMPGRDSNFNRVYVANDGTYIYRSRQFRDNLSMKTTISYRSPAFDANRTNTSDSVLPLPLDGFTFTSRVFTTERRNGEDVPIAVAFYAIPKGGTMDSPSSVLLARLAPTGSGPLQKLGEGEYVLNYKWNNQEDPAFRNSSMEVYAVVEVNGYARARTGWDWLQGRGTWKFAPIDYNPVITAPSVVSLSDTNSSGNFSVAVTQPNDSSLLGKYDLALKLDGNGVPGQVRLGDGTILRVGETLNRTGLNASGTSSIAALLTNLRYEGQGSDPAMGSLSVTATRRTPTGMAFSDSETITLARPNVNLTLDASASSNSPSPMFPRIGDEVTLTVRVANPTGPNVIEATDIEINAALPVSLQFVSASIPANRGSYLPNTGIWKINKLGIGETLTLTVVARVQQGVSPGDTLVLTTQASNPQIQYNQGLRFDTVRFTIGAGNPVRLAARSLPDGGVGTPYFQAAPAFESGATGAGGPYTYFLPSGTLPGGLRLDSSTGAIHGIPRNPGTFTFQIDAADRIGNSAQSNGQSAKTYSILVPEFNLTAGAPSRIDDKADPFSSYWRYSIGGGSLPPGMRLGSPGADNGAIVGTPTVPGTYRFQLRWSGWLGAFPNSKDYVVRVSSTPGAIVVGNNQPLISLRLTTGRALTGSSAIQVFAANNANPPARITTTVTYAAVNLPPGLSLSPNGLLTGTPLISSPQFPSTIYAFDDSGIRSSTTVTSNIQLGALATAGSLPPATSGQPYSQTLPISGGHLGLNSFQAVSLPSGLSLSPEGILSGIPTVTAATQPYTVSFRVGIGTGTGISLTLPLTVLAAPRITNSEISFGLLNSPFSQQFSATGGTSRGYNWSWSGNLPVGLTLNPTTGVMSGKPGFQGRYPVNISVTDSAGAKTTQSFTFVVANAAIPANASSKFVLQSGTTGLSVNSGNIQGMQLSAQGELSGTPVRRAIQILSSRETRSGNWFIRQYRVAVGFPAAGNIETNQGELADLKILPIQSSFVGYTYKLLSPTSFTQPANGTVTFNSTTNSFRFTPRSDFFGTDSFTYTLVNSVGIESIATVSVNVKSLLVVPRGNIPAPAGRATPLGGDRAIQLAPQSWGQGPIQLSMTLARGTLALPTNQEVRATVSGTTTTLTGPIDAVNAVLQGLTYTPASGFSGNMILTVRAEQPRTNGTPLSVSAGITFSTIGRTLHAINAGGTATGSFTADANFTGGTSASISSSIGITTTGITDPAPVDAYRSERWGEFTYNLGSLQAGRSYTVRLDFVEIDATKTRAGLRVFDVAINGTKVLSNFDIFAVAGGQYKVVRREFTATANSSGRISISFSRTAARLDFPKVSTISVME